MFFAAGGFPPPLPERAVAAILNGFQTGAGFGLDMLGPGEVAAGERMSSPVFRSLLPSVIAGVDGLEERLAGGARVAEIGCGSGVLLALLGRRYPESSFEGYDVSQLAVARARQATGDLSNVIVHEAGAEELESGFDVIIAFDCIHDMPHPDRALAAARRAIAGDGIFLIKDIKSAPDFAGNRKNPLLAMMYGLSLTSCLPSALSDRDGMGLGTLGFHPERAREMLTEAGFSSFEVKDFDDPVNLYYVARP
jgi:SAM-dependent methyltransferase